MYDRCDDFSLDDPDDPKITVFDSGHEIEISVTFLHRYTIRMFVMDWICFQSVFYIDILFKSQVIKF